MTAKILAFAGSSRRSSYNRKLVEIAASGAREAGAEVTLIDLGEFELPIFNEDLEADGKPPGATRLKQLFLDHDGLLVASPEYNTSFSPLLKNSLDWVSRPDGDEPRLTAFQGKSAAIMAASPGGLGGILGMTHLRGVLGAMGVMVLPDQVAVRSAYEAFDDDGNLKDQRKQSGAVGLGRSLAQLIASTKR